MQPGSPNPIILYDGVCGLCNRLVQFVLKRDDTDQFRFASLQSHFAADVLQRHGADPRDLDTMYVVLNHAQPGERLLARSDAVRFILRQLGGFWSLASALLSFFPEWIRNRGYDLVAHYRYRIFGKYQTCPLPEERHRRKFMDA